MSLATWDKITGGLGSTTTSFGGNWGNLISDFLNGVNVGLTDPTKLPRINTVTTFKFEKLGLVDGDESHDVLFSVDDIDTGPTRKIKIRRMNTPFETDHMVMEGMPQTLLNKIIDFDLNTVSNITNSNVKAAAGIVYSKLNLSNSIIAADLTSNAVTTAKILDANITLAKLASNSVDSSKIVNDSIVNADINSAAAIASSKLADGSNFVTLTGTQTLTNKTLTLPIISSISNTGTITLPTGTRTLVGKDTTDIFTNKTIDADGTGNSITNIENADIKAAAGIATTKLADSTNFILKTLDNSFGAHYFDMTRMTAPANPAANDGRIFIQQLDTNNDVAYIHIKKNGSFQKVFLA